MLRSRSRVSGLFLPTAVVMAMGVIACSAADTGRTSAFGEGGTGGHHGVGASGSGAGDFGGGLNLGGGTASGISCTADLQGVVDEQGNVTPCPPDKGCSGGTCVAACSAAADSKGSIGCNFL